MAIAKIIEQQERFQQQTGLTLCFLKVYKNNPRDFHLLIGLELQKKYGIVEKIKDDYLWEALDELSSDICHQRIGVHIIETGIFPVLKKGKKPGLHAAAILDKLKAFSEGPWAI